MPRRTALLAALLGLGLATTASAPAAAQGKMPTEMIGNTFRGSNANAANFYSKAMKEKKRAAVETTTERRNHFLSLAKEDFKRSIDVEPTFDGFMALGQVNLALGLYEEAREACRRALGRQPGNRYAHACFEQAVEMLKVPARQRSKPEE
jgi:tetratricopeptide (TPR) repeat protein